MPTKRSICLLVLTAAILFCQQSLALTISDQLKIYGDFRVRLECAMTYGTPSLSMVVARLLNEPVQR